MTTRTNKLYVFSNFLRCIILGFLLVLSGTLYAGTDFINNEIIIKVDAGLDLDSVLTGIDAVALDSISSDRIYLIRINDSTTFGDVLTELQNNPLVDFAEPNYIMELPESFQMSISFPDENNPPHHAGTSPPSFYGQPAIYTTGFDTAQTISEGDGIVVAIIDNGISMNHPLMTGHLSSHIYDFLYDDTIPEEDSGLVYGHGTFVAGLVRLGAPQATIMPLKAFNGEGTGDVFAILQAIEWSITYNVDIINMSFGAHVNSHALSYMVNKSIDSSITVVAAAGNYGTHEKVYPAAYSGVIAVSSVDTLELFAPFSSYGTYIDLCAPGVNLYSSLAGEYEWGTWSGTSFSAALVSAEAALCLDLQPGLNSYQMETHLQTTARKTLMWGTITPPDSLYGYGMLDAAKAVGIGVTGSVSNNLSIDIHTISSITTYLFAHTTDNAQPQQKYDINHDGKIDIIDITNAVDFVFGNNTQRIDK